MDDAKKKKIRNLIEISVRKYVQDLETYGGSSKVPMDRHMKVIDAAYEALSPEEIEYFNSIYATVFDEAARNAKEAISKRRELHSKSEPRVDIKYGESDKIADPEIPSSSQVVCPKCKSSQISANKKGFGLGKAVTGGIIFGGVGLLGGFIGATKVQVTCLACGYSWQAGKN